MLSPFDIRRRLYRLVASGRSVRTSLEENGSILDIITAAIIAMSAQQSPDTTTVVTVQEDSPQWDCTTMGNRICGVGNAQGVPAGDYSQR